MIFFHKLKTKYFAVLLLAIFSIVLFSSANAYAASPTPISGAGPLDRSSPANLVQNGSFEENPDSDCEGYWVSTTANTPVIVVPSWQDSGGASATYAVLTCSVNGMYGADPSWHGDKVLYFGNKYAISMSPEPSSQDANGIWQFASPPVIKEPVNRGVDGIGLKQTVSTQVGTTYRLQFWASGEDAVTAVTSDGIFGLTITGYDTQYLAAPVGPARTYTFEFVATDTKTEIYFQSWGHYNSVSWPSNPNAFGTTELILDDVILNKMNVVPTLSLQSNSQTNCSLSGASVVNSVGADANGDALTYTLKTADPEYFSIDDKSGLVTLAKDNVPNATYSLEVDLTDGTATTSKNIDVVIADAKPCASVITATTGVNSATKVANKTANQSLARTGASVNKTINIAFIIFALGLILLLVMRYVFKVRKRS